jgi:hypothetical protein
MDIVQQFQLDVVSIYQAVPQAFQSSVWQLTHACGFFVTPVRATSEFFKGGSLGRLVEMNLQRSLLDQERLRRTWRFASYDAFNGIAEDRKVFPALKSRRDRDTTEGRGQVAMNMVPDRVESCGSLWRNANLDFGFNSDLTRKPEVCSTTHCEPSRPLRVLKFPGLIVTCFRRRRRRRQTWLNGIISRRVSKQTRPRHRSHGTLGQHVHHDKRLRDRSARPSQSNDLYTT